MCGIISTLYLVNYANHQITSKHTLKSYNIYKKLQQTVSVICFCDMSMNVLKKKVKQPSTNITVVIIVSNVGCLRVFEKNP